MRRIGCLGLILGLLVIGGLFMVMQSWGGSGPAQRTLTVTVPQGASLASAAEQLEEAGAIPSAGRFRLFARFLGSDDPIRAGEYRIPKGLSQADVLKLLQGGRTLQRFVMVPEGWPSVLVQEAVAKAPQMEGPAPLPAEGSILPDSYSYERDGDRQVLVKRMQAAMDRYLAAAWKKRKPTSVVKTPREAIILASIVEKETGKASERRMVAAVYSNRLRMGMRLQADPTVIYPITKGKPLGRRIRKSELQAKNGYNTYASAGLPVGPIANPGKASIDAVLDPASTKALYFVADGTGGHVFADTLAEHNANVKKWYEIRRARGEM
ncbi:MULTISPECIES: endolytic transglycosylase MltG [unclassified Sphingomonas]|uniref:endolytic transglycosylase MltG n=1 Tax=unclassified Sphingomonas TaxID=196159 RepID=UPI0006F26872|nr:MULTISPECIES: endolytic transglycosylase MltG [unclassified Sphingomonas]KQM28467.1 aminodeoxychorismate lyase [Sphingomonas sp. Leaf9]KQM45174.1 aminodeoxychorismate lyase [Sphingomonas sp. Leaf11]